MPWFTLEILTVSRSQTKPTSVCFPTGHKTQTWPQNSPYKCGKWDFPSLKKKKIFNHRIIVNHRNNDTKNKIKRRAENRILLGHQGLCVQGFIGLANHSSVQSWSADQAMMSSTVWGLDRHPREEAILQQHNLLNCNSSSVFFFFLQHDIAGSQVKHLKT